MEAAGVDLLPVVDGANRGFVGVIGRSRLTAGLLLDITGKVGAAR